MTRNPGEPKQSGSRARRAVDDSPKAIQARPDTFVERTHGWGLRAAHTSLAEDMVVPAGPTRKRHNR
jgi:hypothetical protein